MNVKVPNPPPWLEEIAKDISRQEGIFVSDILGYRRYPKFVRARRAIMRAAHASGRSKAEIARAMKLDFSTVSVGLKA